MSANRRTLLRLAATAMILPFVTATARAAGARPPFQPPAGPMLYSRRLERTLADGASYVVTRSFAVRFEAAARGFRVTGEQVDVQVAAPAKLAEFARIERERREEVLFPLHLDANGAITGAKRVPLGNQLDQAVGEALAAISQRTNSAAERAELRQFITAISQSAGQLVTRLPADLFAPSLTPQRATRSLELPGGEAGEVTVSFSAAADPVTGLMEQATREVLTRLEHDSRRTVESWRLAPLI
ncbi:MAG: hypothetical protein ABIT16_05290 [Croceibacterium sp.]